MTRQENLSKLYRQVTDIPLLLGPTLMLWALTSDKIHANVIRRKENEQCILANTPRQKSAELAKRSAIKEKSRKNVFCKNVDFTICEYFLENLWEEKVNDCLPLKTLSNALYPDRCRTKSSMPAEMDSQISFNTTTTIPFCPSSKKKQSLLKTTRETTGTCWSYSKRRSFRSRSRSLQVFPQQKGHTASCSHPKFWYCPLPAAIDAQVGHGQQKSFDESHSKICMSFGTSVFWNGMS